MWLYRHHTCSDIIDLDHLSGRWRPVDDSEKPASARVLADLPVRGSYTVEDGRRYFSYWTDDDRFVFRADDGTVFEICQKLTDGRTLESRPGMRCRIEPAKHGDGRLRQGLSTVTLVDADGAPLYELTYNSEHYLKLYGSDFTAAAMVQDLSDWDFFVALKGAIEIFSERAASGKVPLTIDDKGRAELNGNTVPYDELVFADSGAPSPRSGIWVTVDDVRSSVEVRKGEPLPSYRGNEVRWVWSRER
ncbi:hypothetical protein [Ideonella sp. BN130291]|uniref:hypothetical protein n=1 Tax=Ideonella sp. BN130291 TaxID=3112940 RepID=UPI002E253E05|nr:hypothetical protein [Ideonella sp. BN130291]